MGDDSNFLKNLKKADDFVRHLANGMTFGLADVIAGAAETATTGGKLSCNIAHELKQTEFARNRDPMLSVSGQVIGSAFTGIAVGSMFISSPNNLLAAKAVMAQVGITADLVTSGLVKMNPTIENMVGHHDYECKFGSMAKEHKKSSVVER